MSTALRLGVVLLSAAVLQRGLFAEVRIAGVAVEILLVVAIAAGFVAGEQAGAITGFFAGLLLDLLHVDGPLGLWALTYALVGFVTGRYQRTVTRSARWVPMVTAAVATIGANLAYAAFAFLVDQRNLFDGQLLRVLAVTAVANAVLVLPALRVLRWAWRPEPANRYTLR